MWYVHTTEYLSALKRKETLTHVTSGMSPEDVMLSEISQSQKDKLLYESTQMRYLEKLNS